MVGFRLESYGVGDDRVIRYLDGNIIKEPMIKHIYNQDVSIENSDELHRLNCENWYLLGSTICMASSLWLDKDTSLEWNEAKLDQINGHNILTKLKSIFDYLTTENRLQLSHIVAKHESKCLKYSIFNRNEYLSKCISRLKSINELLKKSLKIQTKFLNILSNIRCHFKVLTNQRNFVDISSLDLDYPTSFSVVIIFYDINFLLDEDIKLWEIWEIHKLSSPFIPQQCLLSYYESYDKLSTKLTFPTNVSYFIKNDFIISINSSTLPVFTKEGNNILYQLRKAQMCLVDRLIFIILAQQSFKYLKSQEILYDKFRVKYVTSEEIMYIYDGQLMIKVNYNSSNYTETGDVVWKTVVTYLRLLVIQYWKRQVFENNLQNVKLLDDFLQYTLVLVNKL